MTCQKSACELKKELTKLFPNCYVQQISTKCLSQYSYYIESDKKAVVVDPIRDINLYTDLLKERDAELLYIFETHFHADFVSGHVELADKTGAKIIYGPNAHCNFHIKIVDHEETIEFTNKHFFQLLHTPGHTMESSCFVLYEVEEKNKKQLAVFTGDTLFLGDVGRPDLAVKEGEVSSEDLASHMYESCECLKKKIENECIVLPGHGAGSACGKNIQTGSYSTFEEQKKTNYALNDKLSRKEFIEILCANIPTPPQYFFTDVLLNRKPITHWDDILKKSLKPIKVHDFEELLNDKDVIVIDSRKHAKVVEFGFVKGTYTISLEMTYAIWSATLFPVTSKIALITDEGAEAESISRLTRVGFENIIGYLEGGFEAWIKEQKPIEKIRYIEVVEAIKLFNDKASQVLDVRNKPELVNPGFIKDSVFITLSELEKNLDKVNNKDSLYVLCKGGNRATIASSILRSHGFKNDIAVIKGGMEALLKEGFKPFKTE